MAGKSREFAFLNTGEMSRLFFVIHKIKKKKKTQICYHLKVSWKVAMRVNLHIAGGYFHALLEVLSACDREQVTHKVQQHMYYLVYPRIYLLPPSRHLQHHPL